MLHFGDTYNSIEARQRRIRVTNDDELANAIEEARRYFPDLPAASVVRELALTGAMAIREAETRRNGAIPFERRRSPGTGPL